jgi:hypothetical protein
LRKNVWFVAAAMAVLIPGGAVTWNAMAQSQPAGVQTVDAPPNYQPPKKRVAPFDGYAEVQRATNPLAKKATPKGPDGKPELTGFWGIIPSAGGPGGLRADGTFEPDQAALQRASGWTKPIYKPEFWNKVRSLDFGKSDVDPVYTCNPGGVPRMNAPAQIIQAPKQVILVYGGLRTRIIPTDGRKLTDQDADMTTFDGVSVGHWDGDTFVVESVGFNDISWLQWQGYFHSDQMKVTERFWRVGDLLFYNFTVDDPDVLLEPWTQGTLALRALPHVGRVGEATPCVVLPASGDPYLRG